MSLSTLIPGLVLLFFGLTCALFADKIRDSQLDNTWRRGGIWHLEGRAYTISLRIIGIGATLMGIVIIIGSF